MSSSSHQSGHPTVHWFIHPNISKSLMSSESVSHSVVSDSLWPHGLLPSPGGSSWPRDQTWVSCIAGRFFTIWATREAHNPLYAHIKIWCTISIHPSLHLSIHLPIYPPIRPSTYKFTHKSIYDPLSHAFFIFTYLLILYIKTHLLIHLFPNINLCLCWSIHLVIHLDIHPFVHSSHPSINQSSYLLIHPSSQWTYQWTCWALTFTSHSPIHSLAIIHS